MSETSPSEEAISDSADKGEQIDRKGNITRITKPEGEYVIVYGKHNDAEAEGIPDDTDAVMIESGPMGYVDPGVEEVLEFLNNFEQFQGALSGVQELNLPLYFTDARPPTQVSEVRGARRDIHAVEAMAGAILAYKARQNLKAHRKAIRFEESPHPTAEWKAQEILDAKLTRREVVGNAAKAGLAAWLAAPLVAETVASTTQNDVRDIKRVSEATNIVHPEDELIDKITIDIRNLVIAHKEQHILESMGNSPSLTSIMGRAHFELEDAIMESPEERMAQLKELQPIIKVAFNDPEFYSYVRVEPHKADDGTIVYDKIVTEVPELKELVQPTSNGDSQKTS